MVLKSVFCRVWLSLINSLTLAFSSVVEAAESSAEVVLSVSIPSRGVSGQLVVVVLATV